MYHTREFFRPLISNFTLDFTFSILEHPIIELQNENLIKLYFLKSINSFRRINGDVMFNKLVELRN